MRKKLAGLFVFSGIHLLLAQPKTDVWLDQLLKEKAPPLLQHVLNNPDSFRYQLIYTKIDRDKKNDPHCTNYYIRANAAEYFNPASTVKMPLAFLSLEKINRLKEKGINKETVMLTDSSFTAQTTVFSDTSAANGLPSVAQYIRKIFLVSDNDAYNRLYEFLGQQTINEQLHKKGYADIRITRRFVTMDEEQNRHTNQVRFVQNEKKIYTQPPAYSNFKFNFPQPILIGKAYYNRNDSLIDAPMDFTKHNNISLEDLQQILQSVMLPSSVKPEQRFDLGPEDYRFLYQYMSELPHESSHPKYDTTEFFDSYCKFFWFKAGKGKLPEYIRSYNKPGWSYGFLTDVAYIVDFKNNVEFMLSGVIYVNRDQVLNDNKYEYEEIGYPFFQQAGKIIYEYELGRKRKVKPNLSIYKCQYN